MRKGKSRSPPIPYRQTSAYSGLSANNLQEHGESRVRSIDFTLYYLWDCWYFPNRQNKKSQSNIERNEVKQYGNEICRARYGTVFWNS